MKIKRGVEYVGVLDPERRLFDSLIPLPDGTSYNSYLVKGASKTALIDTVDPPKAKEFLAKLEDAGLEKLDYIIANHAEQDHSGAIPNVLEKYPESKVVTNQQCKEMLQDLLHIPEDKFKVIEDGEKLDLGGKTLNFIFAPWVHWPETMLTYLEEDKILFSCDLFGSHVASIEINDEGKAIEDAKRYYAEIMMPFRMMIKNHMKKVDDLEIEIIAPSHGPVYNKPEFILNAYRKWISDEVENTVVIAYVSMHGSTEIMVKHLEEKLKDNDITVKTFNLEDADIGELAKALVDCKTVVIGTPTVLGGAHPKAIYAVYLANALRSKVKYATVIGSYGWGGRVVDQVKENIGNLKVELLEPVLVKGKPKDEDLKKIQDLAETISMK